MMQLLEFQERGNLMNNGATSFQERGFGKEFPYKTSF